MISTLKNLHLDLSITFPLFLAVVLAIVLFTVFIYRRTNPIIPNFLKTTLVALRIGALLLTLLVLLESTLRIFHEKKNPPLIAVAVDNSASMTIKDKAGPRAETVHEILKNDLFKELEKDFKLKFYTFANIVQEFDATKNDSIEFIGDATDIQNALEVIKEKNISDNLNGVVLISDGAYNAGGNPVRAAEELGIPVYTVAVGSAEPMTDLAITDVESNPFAYAGQSTPIRVTVHNSGFSSLTLPLQLFADGAIATTETLHIPPSPADKTITLHYTPQKVGRQKLTLFLPTQDGEQTAANNQRTLYIDVFKSKLNILLIAGSISPDISFIRRLLTTDRYKVDALIQKRPGRFYEKRSPDELSDADMFILYDFPTAGSSRDFMDALLQTLATKKQPILLIPGKNASMPELKRLSDYIPVQSAQRPRRERLVYPQLSPLGETHPIMQVSADQTHSRLVWSELPPVFNSFSVQQLAANAKVLAYARVEGQGGGKLSPLLVIRSNGAQKSAALFAHELWRWDLMMWGIDRSDDVWRNLLVNLARWLETNRSENLVRVEMDRANYNYGDPIQMRIEVYDENLNPVSNAEVKISLKRGGIREYSAQAKGEGKYSFVLQPPHPGDFEAVVAAWQGDRKIGEETVIFSVGEYSAELSDLQAQPMVLRGLAQATGGYFTTPDSLGKLVDHITGVATVTPVTRENELWNNKIILLLILLLLTAEWFIRKRRGMI